MGKKTRVMTQGDPLRLLFFFALPLMFGNAFQELYTVVDTAIVGRGVGMEALAAVGAVGTLNWLFLGITQGFMQGCSVRMAQKLGSGDTEGLKRTMGVSIRISVWVAVLATLISHCTLSLFLDWMRVQPDLRNMAQLYIRILYSGIPIEVFYNFCAATLRALGDSKTPLRAMLIASVVNIVLDSVTVFLLKWGIAGAAGATLFSQAVAGGICLLRVMSIPELRLSRKHLAPEKSMELDLMKLGIPAALQNMIIAGGSMCVHAIVNGFPLSFIAGFTATNRLYGILEIAAVSYGYAVTTYVGQNFGAKDYSRIRRGMRSAVLMSVVTSGIIAVAMIVFGRSITMLFISADSAALAAEAGDAAYRFLFIMSVTLPILYLLYVYRAALQGLGNTLVPMLSGLAEFTMRIVVSAAIGSTGYEDGIFYAEPAAWLGAAIVLIFTYYHTVRRFPKEQTA